MALDPSKFEQQQFGTAGAEGVNQLNHVPKVHKQNVNTYTFSPPPVLLGSNSISTGGTASMCQATP